MDWLSSSSKSYKNLKNDAQVKAGTKLSDSDWAGYGVQALGGYLQDNSAQKEAELEREREDALLQQQAVNSAKDRMLREKQFAADKAQRERAMNMQGLNYLTELTNQNEAAGRKTSFIDALIAAGSR